MPEKKLSTSLLSPRSTLERPSVRTLLRIRYNRATDALRCALTLWLATTHSTYLASFVGRRRWWYLLWPGLLSACSMFDFFSGEPFSTWCWSSVAALCLGFFFFLGRPVEHIRGDAAVALLCAVRLCWHFSTINGFELDYSITGIGCLPIVVLLLHVVGLHSLCLLGLSILVSGFFLFSQEVSDGSAFLVLAITLLVVLLAASVEYQLVSFLEASKAQEKKVVPLMESATDGFCLVDIGTGIVLDASRRLERVLGCETVVGMRFVDFLIDDDDESLLLRSRAEANSANSSPISVTLRRRAQGFEEQIEVNMTCHSLEGCVFLQVQAKKKTTMIDQQMKAALSLDSEACQSDVTTSTPYNSPGRVVEAFGCETSRQDVPGYVGGMDSMVHIDSLESSVSRRWVVQDVSHSIVPIRSKGIHDFSPPRGKTKARKDGREIGPPLGPPFVPSEKYLFECTLSLLEDILESFNVGGFGCCTWHVAFGQLERVMHQLEHLHSCREMWKPNANSWQCSKCSALNSPVLGQSSCWICQPD